MTNAPNRPAFGTLLREFRLAAGLSQEALAERASMSADGIGALERGVNKAPQRETLALLLNALQLGPQQRGAIEAAARRPSLPRSTRRTVRKHNLPRLFSPLIGRDGDLEEVVELLLRSQLLTLTGAGGVGKTRLAVEAAYAALHEYVDGAWFADLAPVRDSNGVAAVVAGLFEVRERPDRRLLAGVVEILRPKNTLLILDNCEHVVESASVLVEAIRADCPNVRILATSREPLHIPGEQAYRVASLSAPAAVDLFADVAKRADPSFGLNLEDAPVVQRICARLDGIALAIELAAANVKLFSVAQIEELLSKRFSLLTGNARLARHQTMRALIDWSYELLSQEERLLFNRLGVFASGFMLEAAIAVCSGAEIAEARVLGVLAALVDKSLAISERWGKARRFRLLETIRAYALERLGAAIDDLSRKHAAYYLGVIEARDLAGRIEPDTFAAEFDEVRRALEWSIDSEGDVAIGVRLLAGVREVLLQRGLAAESARRAEHALQYEDELDPPLGAKAWEVLAAMRGELLLPADSLAAANRALTLYETLDDCAGIARTLRNRSIAELRLGQFSAGEEDLRRGLELSERYGTRRDVLRTLGGLGVCFQITGRLEEARQTTLEVLEMARSDGDQRLFWISAMNLAEIEFSLGEAERAAAQLKELLAGAVARQNTRFRAHAQSNLAAYLVALGHEAEARASARAAVIEAREAGDKGIMAFALGHLAAMMARREAANAARLLGYVESIFASGYKREPTERYTYGLLTEALEQSLTQSEIAAYQTEGATMTEDHAVRLATRASRAAAI
jgi:predicted ATPase/DNA-binding XRE family transcriptional regulator